MIPASRWGLKMNDNLGMTPETPKPWEGERRANVSAYLDRPSSTILMLIKLAEAEKRK